LSTSASKRLINRARELDELRRHIKSVRSGSSAVVLLGGEAGIGKSRLIAEVTAEFDGMVLAGGCLPVGEQSLPYLPIIEMLRWSMRPELSIGRPHFTPSFRVSAQGNHRNER